VTEKAECYVILGEFDRLGAPTKIVMTKFNYLSSMNCRFAFINPNNHNVHFSVLVKAYGGTSNAALNPYGNLFMGEYEFNEIFMVTNNIPSTNSYTIDGVRCPVSGPGKNTTVQVFSADTTLGTSRSAMASFKIYDSALGEDNCIIC